MEGTPKELGLVFSHGSSRVLYCCRPFDQGAWFSATTLTGGQRKESEALLSHCYVPGSFTYIMAAD